MAIRIDQKIIEYGIKSREEAPAMPPPRPKAEVIQMHEKLERPEVLLGSTYKVKTPLSEHALYVTINDVVLNAGTEHEQRRPFEIFINSKNMEHFQWIVGAHPDRVRGVPQGRRRDVPRRGVAIGVRPPRRVLQEGRALHAVAGRGDRRRHRGAHAHDRLIEDEPLDEHRRRLIEEKRAQRESMDAANDERHRTRGFPDGAQFCAKCQMLAVVRMDGCMTASTAAIRNADEHQRPNPDFPSFAEEAQDRNAGPGSTAGRHGPAYCTNTYISTYPGVGHGFA